MTAAIAAARSGDAVTLVEKNEKLGKKLYITGKGRCNLTNDCDEMTFIDHVVHNPSFMYSAIYSFTHDDLMQLIEANGCPLKVERGNRVFPVSDKSSDVIKAFRRALEAEPNVQILLNTEAKLLCFDDAHERVTGLKLANGEVLTADKIILATGGLSYRSTGSTGWGHQAAKVAGHTVTPCRPSLVGLKTKETWPQDLQGLTLKNVETTLWHHSHGSRRKIDTIRGELLLTHFGISGPIVLTFSAQIDDAPSDYSVTIDLKPALDFEKLDARLLRDFAKAPNKQIDHGLKDLLPKKMIPVMLTLAGIDPTKRINQISKAERHALVVTLKKIEVHIADFYDFNSAIVTSGGVDVKEVDPGTMASKKVRGLYLAGELLDVDGVTGGFNIQIAASTGYLAGNEA